MQRSGRGAHPCGTVECAGDVDSDHYRILGITPAADAAAIRVAYREQMRLYHPDSDPSPGAEDRARAINAAYFVLRDPQRRSRYDAGRRALAAESGLRRDFPSRRRSRAGPILASLIASLAFGLLIYAMIQPVPGLPEPANRKARTQAPAALARQSAVNEPPPVTAEQGFAAASLPLSDPLPEARPADPENSVTGPGQSARAGRVSDLPALRAPVEPVAFPSELERSGAEPSPAPAEQSVECEFASARSDQMMCNSPTLARLDRQMALFFAQSLGAADPAKRRILIASRDQFAARRARCRTAPCIESAYLDRIREIAEIMSGS